jgi:hypothetical protein
VAVAFTFKNESLLILRDKKPVLALPNITNQLTEKANVVSSITYVVVVTVATGCVVTVTPGALAVVPLTFVLFALNIGVGDGIGDGVGDGIGGDGISDGVGDGAVVAVACCKSNSAIDSSSPTKNSASEQPP